MEHIPTPPPKGPLEELGPKETTEVEAQNEEPINPELERLEESLEADISEIKEDVQKPENKMRFLKTLGKSGLAITTGLFINYVYQFRDKVSEKITPEGVEYAHEDAETEHILNVLSGKEQYTESEKDFIVKNITKQWCRVYHQPIPDDIENWTLEKFKEFHKGNSAGDRRIENIDDILTTPFHMKRLHASLWDLAKRSGSPKIRWSTAEESWLSDEYHRAHYNPLTNTILLAPEDIDRDFFEMFVKESTHAIQFKDNPISSSVVAVMDFVKTATVSYNTQTSLEEAQLHLYDRQGTLEYDAHKIIEPKLRSKVYLSFSKDLDEHNDLNKNSQ